MASELPPGVDLSKIPGMAPPPGVVPNFAHPESQAYATIVGNSVVTALMIVIVMFRFYTKLFITKNSGWDDICCGIAVAMAIAYLGMIIAVFEPGYYGSHQWDVPVSALLDETTVKLLRALNYLYGPATTFAKLSILLLYCKLFRIDRKIRFVIYFVGALTIITHTVGLFLSIGICPSSDPIAYSECTGQLVTTDIAISSINIFSDFYILAIPLLVIPQLQIARKRKLGLIAVFLTGLLACLSSILGLTYRIEMLNTHDTTWYMSPLLTFTIMEVNIGIIVASIPIYPALFRTVQTSKVFTSLYSKLSTTYSKFSSSTDSWAGKSVGSNNSLPTQRQHMAQQLYPQPYPQPYPHPYPAPYTANTFATVNGPPQGSDSDFTGVYDYPSYQKPSSLV